MLKHHRTWLTLATLSLLAGCNQSAPSQQTASEPADPPTEIQTAEVPAALQRTTTSGFLSDYSTLKPNPLHKTSLLERSDKLDTYKTFIVETPKVIPTATVRGVPIDAATSAQIAMDLKAAATESLGINFKIADKAGPGIARIRTAVTQIAESYHDIDSPNLKVGGASIEMEIVDSVTGEHLAAATASDSVTSHDPQLKSTEPYYDTRLVFQSWSSRLAKWLVDAQQ